MRIGDEVFVHGYVDEIRKDCVIIRNDGGYFGTIEDEIVNVEIKAWHKDYVEPMVVIEQADTPQTDCETCKHYNPHHEAIACERCLDGKYSRYEPQTDCEKYLDKIRPHDLHKDWVEDEPQTDCGWGEPND